jgi:hypothetical protein
MSSEEFFQDYPGYPETFPQEVIRATFELIRFDYIHSLSWENEDLPLVRKYISDLDHDALKLLLKSVECLVSRVSHVWCEDSRFEQLRQVLLGDSPK